MTWGTPVQSFVFLGLLVFELEPHTRHQTDRRTDRQTDDGRRSPHNRRGHNNELGGPQVPGRPRSEDFACVLLNGVMSHDVE